ncbi:hypothetical protein PTSG_05285 [Salpingoeca rosetta]|uniref:Uncharacterized protein n=1 Tax=Salpingoeca rosetta (strain ATCC 50818 / BSB-021) TaxID=946362 RepID=F2UA02_SALR5|nr:uncharacterized protein PTSG_05285 [Salpingoeca rosetta]EGD73577.1 hypothetical protein PTSG_05285 [Salpingoeca rosetta]|eukprot:XP_004993859.1 hypothetical protein PTSG_05285 [Salpingoeca rosetta]
MSFRQRGGGGDGSRPGSAQHHPRGRGRGRGGSRGGRGGERGRGGGRGRGRGGSGRRNRREDDPRRRYFDAIKKKDGSATIKSHRDCERFLENVREHNDRIHLMYSLESTDMLNRLTLFLGPTNNVNAYLRQYLIPALEIFAEGDCDLPSMQNQRDTIFLALMEAPNLFPHFTKYLKLGAAPDTHVSFLGWFLTELAGAARRNNKRDEILERQDLKDLVDTLCAREVPFAEVLRGHLATNGNGNGNGNNALPPDQLHLAAFDPDSDALVPFRDISVTPTVNDIGQAPPAHLPRPPFTDSLEAVLNGQFRLLREALLGPIRERLQDAAVTRASGKEAFRTLFKVGPVGANAKYGAEMTFTFELHHNHPYHKRKKSDKAMFWERTSLLKRGSLVLLLQNGEPAMLAEVMQRDPKTLLNDQTVGLRMLEPGHLDDVIKQRTTRYHGYTMVMVAPNFFAFRPILQRLQDLHQLPFKEELLGGQPPEGERAPEYWRDDVQVEAAALAEELTLNPSQREALMHGMSNRVALIQGPPGTGKTFIGVALAKLLVRTCRQRILLCCYTNHALDQFLMELIEHVTKNVVRIGGHCKEEALEPYRLEMGKSDWTRDQASRYHELKDERTQLEKDVQRLDNALKMKMGVKWWSTLRRHLEDEHPDMCTSLSLPPHAAEPLLRQQQQQHRRRNRHEAEGDGFQVVGKDGKAVGLEYLFERWYEGKDAGVFAQYRAGDPLWALSKKERRAKFGEWEEEIRAPQREELARKLRRIRTITAEIDALRACGQEKKLANADVIACTTWGAAQNAMLLQRVRMPVVMAEEAGEVLEAHILTALPRDCKHLILIGDHKQLRPKVDHYPLTRESGKGFDLNVSMFERLADTLPVAKLQVQHRMRPEFSRLVREVFYPGVLGDHHSVEGREHIRGLQGDLVFINHKELEAAAQAKMVQHQSHSNPYEVGMVRATVRYLIQQQYDPSEIVVLTPYLGQLLELRTALADVTHNVGVAIDDRDIADARQAGADLDTSVRHEHVHRAATAGKKGAKDKAGDDRQQQQRKNGDAGGGGGGGADDDGKGNDDVGDLKKQKQAKAKAVRVATIDNYQGEESNIIILSLVRSNKQGSIGFLKEKERVNVMLSRAKLGMIIIGNLDTFYFAKAEKGRDMWQKLIDIVPAGCITAGLPVCCQQHAEVRNVLRTPQDFDLHARDGGCERQCVSVLACGHPCPLKCHSGSHDHIRCTHEEFVKCHSEKHVLQVKCYQLRAVEEMRKPLETQQRRVSTSDTPSLYCSFCVREGNLKRSLERAKEQRQKQEIDNRVKMKLMYEEIMVEHERQLAELEQTRHTRDYEAERRQKENEMLESVKQIRRQMQQETAEAEEQLLKATQDMNAKLKDLEEQAQRKRVQLTGEMTKRLQQLRQEEERARTVADERARDEQRRLQEQLRAEQQRIRGLEATLAAQGEQHRQEVEERRAQVLLEARRRQQHLQNLIRTNRARTNAELRQVEAAKKQLAEEEFECCICFDVKQRVDGITCKRNPHFMCDECFDGYVHSIATHEERLANGPEVRCPGIDCDSPAFTFREVAQHVGEETSEQLFKLIRELAEKDANADSRRRIEEEVERRLKQTQQERKKEEARKHITGEILTLRCPRCKTAFVDFDGCFALTCNNCKCGFCAWCLRDCGTNAHQCAARCGTRHGGRGYHGTEQQFNDHHRKRRQRLLDEYMATLEPEVREAVTVACEKDARDLGLVISSRPRRRSPSPPPAAAVARARADGVGGDRRVAQRGRDGLAARLRRQPLVGARRHDPFGLVNNVHGDDDDDDDDDDHVIARQLEQMQFW